MGDGLENEIDMDGQITDCGKIRIESIIWSNVKTLGFD